MKKKFLSVMLFLAIILNIGCEKLDVTKDITFEAEFNTVSDSSNFYSEELLNFVSLSSVIAEYSNNIKSIELLKVTYQITKIGNSNAATNIASVALRVTDDNPVITGDETIGTIENQNCEVVSGILPLFFEIDGATRFEELIKNSPHTALVKISGSADGAPVDFTVKFVFTVKMTANPL